MNSMNARSRQPAAAVPDEPRILPIGTPAGGRGPGPRPVSPRELVATVVAEVCSRHDHRLPMPTVECDIPAQHLVHADPAALRLVLTMLIENAIEAASRPAAPGMPPIREVVVTSVESAEAIEIEVADSGPTRAAGLAAADPDSAALGPLVERLGGTLHAITCPEGGMACTLRVPHRRARLAA